MDISIRNATEADLPAIRKLIEELAEVITHAEKIDLNSVEKKALERLANPDTFIYLAEGNGEPLGLLTISLRQTLLHSTPSGLIDELVVSKIHRRKGIGKALMDFAVEECQRLGCGEAEVGTEVENAKARKFYLDFGFEEIGVLFEKGLE